ncbi:tryptophanyl-tRNA synthetase [Marchantia polymorpha subsp. ruderalis]|uniref:tryptophan--tRNA ligase n=1 Tax=Marchantia polymorpha TaxID=3197 RepID=A0A2R6W6Z8_MARPO|nr:hypothetical protein MARPO_0137s0001 [Marchantia polymorpha]BBN02871.1 hypothetical protein Mp_2g18820 [Marchantia polymorpha subsp. ruderalis]|eukprot:PTQ29626.1 hypothetical protein MARPO_0137s0001 [Marchantia polymorpha]
MAQACVGPALRSSLSSLSCCTQRAFTQAGRTSLSLPNITKSAVESQRRARHLRVCAQVSSPIADSVPVTSPSDGESSAQASTIKKRVVSGVQPTGAIHLGNYLGAIKNWVALQDVYDTLFFVVDLHAITLPHEPKELIEATKKSAALYIACGVDPSKASIFVQSHVRAHAELTWLLSCVTPISWLNKMIQFKEKARKSGEDVGTGLLTYPLLMASDILLYQCDLVPVGEDQRQHLELTRDVADRVNNIYGGKKWKKRGGPGGRIFKVPDALIPPAGARIMSLTDGTSKMSKSAPSDQSRINLLDTRDEIVRKITRCKTDSFTGMEFDNPDRPECTNLLGIYQLVSGKTKEEVAEEVKDMNWGQFKPLLADALVEHLTPIQKRYGEVVAEPAYLDGILKEGAERAEVIANATLENIQNAMGFLPRQRR